MHKKHVIILSAAVVGVGLALLPLVHTNTTASPTIAEQTSNSEVTSLQGASDQKRKQELAELLSGLPKARRELIEKRVCPEARELLTIGSACLENPDLCESNLVRMLEIIKLSPAALTDQAGWQSTAVHPDDAVFGLSVLMKAWKAGAKIDSAFTSIQSEAVRLSACDDEVIRAQCAAVLLAIQDDAHGSRLTAENIKALDKLLSNEVVAMYAERVLKAWRGESQDQ